ncbi:unnamed protein product [Arabidopsis thaliana]|uniref:(thale cress) hypothetical protein n=1 Tax=Arabidopsis thaliana TaxID=3702 RepID=A0A7G2EU58_ARATH|nr:unnamed protein product [Arabidopsis thaliana]
MRWFREIQIDHSTQGRIGPAPIPVGGADCQTSASKEQVKKR